MKYLCAIYIEEKTLERMPSGDIQSVVDECLAYDQELRQSGHLIAAEALESIQTATTIRVRNGKPSVTDGPFAETKEQLAGFFMINARDLNEAIRIASRLPQARIGSIEVRPIKEFEAA